MEIKCTHCGGEIVIGRKIRKLFYREMASHPRPKSKGTERRREICKAAAAVSVKVRQEKKKALAERAERALVADAVAKVQFEGMVSGGESNKNSPSAQAGIVEPVIEEKNV